MSANMITTNSCALPESVWMQLVTMSCQLCGPRFDWYEAVEVAMGEPSHAGHVGGSEQEREGLVPGMPGMVCRGDAAEKKPLACVGLVNGLRRSVVFAVLPPCATDSNMSSSSSAID